MEQFFKYLVMGVGFMLILFLIITLSAWFVMLLINWLFTPAALMAVFGTAKIGFWQAWGISLLTGILFKSTSTSK